MPKDFNRLLFSIVSSFIFSNPPLLYNSLGDENASLRRFLLRLTLTTIPPSSSTAVNIGILDTLFESAIILITSSLVLSLKSLEKNK